MNLTALSQTPRRYAFVVPRFGENIAGGAETLVGNLAARLSQRGDKIQILTTCAKDNRTWDNDFPAGDAIEYGIAVKRFPVDARNLDIWIPMQISISEGMRLALEDQFAWFKHGVNSEGLYSYLAKHAGSYDAVFFAPYLFATTFWGSLIHPKNSVLIPCLHDEHYAYVDVIGSMFRQVKGALFNAAPEQDFARSLYGQIKGGEVGMGFEPVPEAEVQSLTPYFDDGKPYILYLGRKETGKNAQLLLDYFCEFKRTHNAFDDLQLVICGGGSFSDLGREKALSRGDILDIAHVSEHDKKRLLRHAQFLCQPSTNESFSIVLMEAWLLGTPVLVHARCPVTREHAVASGGGLYFADQNDFNGVLLTLLSDKSLRVTMGKSGHDYVRERYDWRAVLERFDSVTQTIFAPDAERPSTNL